MNVLRYTGGPLATDLTKGKEWHVLVPSWPCGSHRTPASVEQFLGFVCRCSLTSDRGMGQVNLNRILSGKHISAEKGRLLFLIDLTVDFGS